ncbi:MAG: isochorismate synthase, partial [Proteobacteria bacterium]
AREAAALPAYAPSSGAGEGAYRIDADRPPAAFRALVAAARDAVASGLFEKLVVARSVRFASAEPIDVPRLVAALRRTHPRCTTFAVARGADVFVGATPERLLRVDFDRVETAALAGTAPRGRTPDEDARLAAALRESKKEQEEHAIVVRELRAALAPLCASLDVPEAPALLQMEGVQHLATPLRGVLAAPANALALAGRLHPTPAVGGAPRSAAVAWLAAHESLARGWYAGGVGWLDPACGGELAVALRCARVRGGEARLFAGAGVVAASDPQAELEETRLKLRALLAPLLEL